MYFQAHFLLNRLGTSQLLKPNMRSFLFPACKWTPALTSQILVNNPLVVNKTGFTTSGALYAKHKFKPYVAPAHEDHDYKNMRMKRPMSPHLTIYAPTLVAMTSIVQRITGTIITFYAIMLAGGSLFLTNGVETYVSIIQSFDLSRTTVFFVKLLMGLPFVYHYFCGIRFVAWNLGKWLSIKEVYNTATRMFIITAALSVLFAII